MVRWEIAKQSHISVGGAPADFVIVFLLFIVCKSTQQFIFYQLKYRKKYNSNIPAKLTDSIRGLAIVIFFMILLYIDRVFVD